ncbi:hypothetical protein LYNGBM3L_53160 [Moorena producens 3L]|uniref:Uncharacterized protein n=1 Tax=Moorena producens 3L TaxID=489825 RepID=F4XYZ4_9CYAN|nr:hypothetical protein LYNGBM3L_53160 [Moorena producens 3L]
MTDFYLTGFELNGGSPAPYLKGGRLEVTVRRVEPLQLAGYAEKV